MRQQRKTEVPSNVDLQKLLANKYSHFRKVGEDDYRDPSENNPGLSLSSNGYYDHKTGNGGSLSKLARDESRDVNHRGLHQDHIYNKPSANKPEKATSDKAAYLWEKANTGEEARAVIEEYLTGIRRIPPENYMDLIDSSLLRYLPASGEHPLVLVHPFQFIEQDGLIRLAVRKIHLTRKEGNPRKNHLGSDGHLTVLPPLDPTNADNSILAIEGLEDALSLRRHNSHKRIVVTGSKGNLKHLMRLIQPGQDVLIIADHDDNDNVHQNGQYEADRVRKQLSDHGVNCVALMPKQPKWDANAALQDNNLEGWLESLVEVSEFEEPKLPEPSTGFHFLRFGELKMRTPEMLVGRILECNTLVSIYGDSGVGKSFLALDLAFCVASGQPWHGEVVQQGGVFYLAGEGREGLIRRRQAWEMANDRSLEEAPLYLSTKATDLADEQSRIEVLEQIREVAKQDSLKLVIVDTLSRHFGGRDENQAGEMAKFVECLDHIRQEFGMTVLLVHHTGKDANRGARGSSVLRAALDNEILVKRERKGLVKLTNEKMKDAEPFQPMAFQLASVTLRDGRELVDECRQIVTSCVLVPAEVPRQVATKAPPRTGAHQQKFDHAFAQKQQLEQGPIPLEAIRSETNIPANRWQELLKSKHIEQKYRITGNSVELAQLH